MLEVVLIGVAATAVLSLTVGWAGWVSVTLIKILQGITRNDERGDDHERRLTAGGL